MFPSNRLHKLMSFVTFFEHLVSMCICICHCVFVFDRSILASTNLPAAEIEVQLLAGGWMGSLTLKAHRHALMGSLTLKAHRHALSINNSVNEMWFKWLQNIFDTLQERWSEYCLGPIWWGPKGLGKNFQAFSFHISKGLPIENLSNTRNIRNI